MVWKLERKISKRRISGGKCTGGGMVWDFLAKIHSNDFRVVSYVPDEVFCMMRRRAGTNFVLPRIVEDTHDYIGNLTEE